MGVSTCAACALVVGVLAGCTQPVAYPRSAHVLQGGKLGFGLRSNIAHAWASAELEQVQPPAGSPGEEATFEPNPTFAVFGVPAAVFSAEGQGAVGIVDGLELSALIGPQRGGLELRARLLEEWQGAPFSLAISGAATMGTLIVSPERIEPRGGLDLSVDDDGTTYTVGAYVAYGRREYDYGDGTLVIFNRVLFNRGTILAQRDELRLSLPLGVIFHGALGVRTRSSTRRGGFIIGLVPELTLRSRLRSLSYSCDEDCEHDNGPLSFQAVGFSQAFALLLTVGLELGDYGPPPPPPGVDPWQ